MFAAFSIILCQFDVVSYDWFRSTYDWQTHLHGSSKSLFLKNIQHHLILYKIIKKMLLKHFTFFFYLWICSSIIWVDLFFFFLFFLQFFQFFNFFLIFLYIVIIFTFTQHVCWYFLPCSKHSILYIMKVKKKKFLMSGTFSPQKKRKKITITKSDRGLISEVFLNQLRGETKTSHWFQRLGNWKKKYI